MIDDDYDGALLRSTWKFALARAEALARKVAHAMQRAPATGIFDDFAHRSLWDEFCYECQEGPHWGLEAAWDHSLGRYLTAVSDRVDQLEKNFLERALADPGREPIQLVDAVENSLRELAGQRDLSKF